MKKPKRYDRVLSYGATSEQIKKLQNISKIVGKSMSNVVRELIDSALPDVDPEDRFWRACMNSGIFKIDVPADTVVAFIASFLDLPLTGKNKIDNIEIKANAPNGISPTLWALKHIQEAFYEKGISVRANKQGEPKDDQEEQGGAESD